MRRPDSPRVVRQGSHDRRLASASMTDPPLPHPDSEQLAATIPSQAARALYGLLFRRRDGNPPTEQEATLYLSAGSWLDADVRLALAEVRTYFVVDARLGIGGTTRLLLRGWADPPKFVDEPFVSDRLRAQILAPQRCAQCGKTPTEDEVKLEVVLKLPAEWGGVAEPENLQPLCTQCATGKQQYHETYAAYGEKIRLAANYDEPQKRLGELLRAFGDDWVRSDLLAAVASAKDYQDDWQRRMRELRDLGWDYRVQRRYNEGSRVWAYYQLSKTAPWPDDIRATIDAAAEARRARRRSAN